MPLAPLRYFPARQVPLMNITVAKEAAAQANLPMPHPLEYTEQDRHSQPVRGTSQEFEFVKARCMEKRVGHEWGHGRSPFRYAQTLFPQRTKRPRTEKPSKKRSSKKIASVLIERPAYVPPPTGLSPGFKVNPHKFDTDDYIDEILQRDCEAMVACNWYYQFDIVSDPDITDLDVLDVPASCRCGMCQRSGGLTNYENLVDTENIDGKLVTCFVCGGSHFRFVSCNNCSHTYCAECCAAYNGVKVNK